MKLDAEASLAGKEAGQQLALLFAVEWSSDVVKEFRNWSAKQKLMGQRTITIEQFRSQSNAVPNSHKAWGCLPRLLMQARLVRPAMTEDGEPRYMRAAAPKTHAHPVRLWRLV